MGQAVLVREQVDGGTKLLARLRDRGFGARGACWGKRGDDSTLHLFIVWPGEYGGHFAPIREALQSLESEWSHVFEKVRQSDTRVIAPTHPLARGLLDLYDHYPDQLPIWESSYNFGDNEFLDSVFVYPPELFSQPAPAGG
jgi:hypothetical protein